jgi:twinkle protein
LSKCLEKLPHSCGSSDGLQTFINDDDSVSGYCFSCGSYVDNPYGEKRSAKDMPKLREEKSDEQIEREMEEISSLNCYNLSERKLRKDALEYYGVKIALSEVDGQTPIAAYFPYTKNGKLNSYKARLLSRKTMWNVGRVADRDFFGWEQAKASGAKRLIITEGEFDAIALYKILQIFTEEKYKEYTPAVISITNGASGAAKELAKHLSDIRKNFKEVSLCFDADEAGRKALDECLKVIPTASIISLPAKDANECIVKGLGREAFKAITFKAAQEKSTRLILGSELRDAAKIRPERGLTWPWEGFTKLTRGIRRKETYYFGAGVKMGKSELVNAITDHLIREHNQRVLICKPEEDKAKTYQMLVGKAAGRIFHDPDIPFDEEAFDRYEPLIGDKAIIVDNYQFVNWDALRDDIRYAVKAEGVHDIIIDPVTCFTNGMSAADTNEFLVGWAAELAAMAKDLEFTSYIFCHLKAPESGPPHERGGEVLSTQFTGSRAMMRSCHMMVGLEGNKNPDLSVEERNIRKLKILEDRNLGATGVVKLYWDNRTGLFNEMRV